MNCEAHVLFIIGKYLVAITSRTLTGTIQAHKIWRIISGVIIPVLGTVWPTKVDQLDDDLAAKVI